MGYPEDNLVLFIARAGRKHGIGHYKRMRALSSLTEGRTAFALFCPASEAEKLRTALPSDMAIPENDRASLKAALDLALPATVVLDIREAPEYLLRELAARSIPCVSWDDYGAGLRSSEALIAPLPHRFQPKANFSDPRWLPLPAWTAATPSAEWKKLALVTFGGSDPSGSARVVTEALCNGGLPDGWRVRVIEGPLADYSSWKSLFPEAQFVRAPENLASHIAESALVFTSIGMTLAEARALSKPAVLVTPARYHAKIADGIAAASSSVIHLGMSGRLKAAQVRSALERFPSASSTNNGAIAPFDLRASWNALLSRLEANGSARCPVCGSSRRKAVHRAEDQTLFVCLRCRCSHKYFLRPPVKQYDESYFGANHAAAYGKTYLEDEEAIRAFSRRRLEVIRGMLPHAESPRMLDCGSALGVFASEANRTGFSAEGLEISEHARKTARELFGVESLASIDDCAGPYDAVSMWFFLEHFDHPQFWIAKARELLRDGGVLALGLPHGDGALARFNPRLYAQIRPEEHCFEPSLTGMARFLEKSGFRVERREYFGLHPNRIGLPRWKFFMKLQKILALGDTFELYARKLPAPR